jgi:uncharacterized membrane protein YdfJ with MMPL/SSD domain
MIERLTRTMIRYRWLVVAAWVGIFIVSFMAMTGLQDLFTQQQSLPGTDVQRAEDVL